MPIKFLLLLGDRAFMANLLLSLRAIPCKNLTVLLFLKENFQKTTSLDFFFFLNLKPN